MDYRDYIYLTVLGGILLLLVYSIHLQSDARVQGNLEAVLSTYQVNVKP